MRWRHKFEWIKTILYVHRKGWQLIVTWNTTFRCNLMQWIVVVYQNLHLLKGHEIVLLKHKFSSQILTCVFRCQPFLPIDDTEL